jgi:hypothetical protein
MNQDQLNGTLRIVVPAICAWLAAKGLSVLGNEQVIGYVVQIAAAGIGLAAAVMSFKAHTTAAKLEAVAAIDPKVEIKVPLHVIVEDEKVAALVKDPTVPNVTAVKPPEPYAPLSSRKKE